MTALGIFLVMVFSATFGFVLCRLCIGGGKIVAGLDVATSIRRALMDNTDGKVDADLITIEVGANDGSAPLGDITHVGAEEDGSYTICGALNECIKNILMNCPKAQVVLMPSTRGRYSSSDASHTPLELGNVRAGGFTFLELDEALRKVALANGIYFIPFSALGLGLFRAQSGGGYLADHIHHTELGGYNLAQGVWSYLKNIPLWYNELPQN